MEVLKEARVRNNMCTVNDGVAALAYLRREGDYAEASRPDLILLDLNLPKKDGRELLAEIKADPNLRRIPVVVLSVSKDEEDILKSYDLYANCYITKPINLEEFITVVKSIEGFWLTIVKLPPDVKR
jgi:CheY-like chemotaxis protein